MIKKNDRTRSYLPHASHDTKFLGTYETFQHNPNGHIDIIFIDIIPEMHTSMGLSHSDHWFNVTDCDGDTASGLQIMYK